LSSQTLNQKNLIGNSATNNLLSQSLGIISHALNNASTSSIASQSLPSPSTNSNAASNIAAAVLNSQSNVLSQLSTLFPQTGSSSTNASNIPYASNLYNILNNPSKKLIIIFII
jgi:hypothetical protein